MAALEFPDTPAAGDIYDAPNGVQYQFDGLSWNVISAAAGVPGPQGEQGLSAYDVAVSEGFVGTEQEWLNSLVGPEGQPGADSTVPGPVGFAYAGRVGSANDLPSVIDIAEIYDVYIADDTGIGWQCIANASNANGKDWIDLGRLVGQDGSTGAPGVDGSAGVQGETGAAGADGASAYQVALQNGFVGTEAEWLASLEGEQGQQGLGLRYAGRVPTAADLNTVTGQVHGDVYIVDETGNAYVWNATVDPAKWDDAGQIVGSDGQPGAAGLSAYQVAVADGFTGTEQEWLDSLIGPPGPTAVSSDASNISRLGSDNKIFTPATDLTGYVPRTGADMTGPLKFKGDGITSFEFDNGFNFYGLLTSSALRVGTKSLLGFTENDVVAAVPFRLTSAPTTDEHATNKRYVDEQIAAGGSLPIATATRLGGVKIGTGMTVTADGTISTTASTDYVRKTGDVMNGALRYSDIGGVSTFNGTDVYTYFGGGYYRIHLPGGKSGIMIEVATAKVTFAVAPKCAPAPVDDSDLANKSYVDSAVSSSTAYLKTTGGTMTGGITLPTTVQSLTWGTSTYNIFGAAGGVAVRFGNANIVNFTATGASFTQKITTPGTGVGVEFGSSGAYLSKVGTGIGAYVGGALRWSFGATEHMSTIPIASSAAATAANHLVPKSYVDDKPTIVSMPAGGTAPSAASYPNNTLLVEYQA